MKLPWMTSCLLPLVLQSNMSLFTLLTINGRMLLLQSTSSMDASLGVVLYSFLHDFTFQYRVILTNILYDVAACR
jgi:hypothetical protein